MKETEPGRRRSEKTDGVPGVQAVSSQAHEAGMVEAGKTMAPVGGAAPGNRAKQPVRVLFHVYIPYRSPGHAGIQQTVRVAYYLAQVGAGVTLWVCSWYFQDEDSLLNFFGLERRPNFRVRFFPHPFPTEGSKPLMVGWGMAFHLLRFLILLLTREKRAYDVFFARGYRFPALHVLFKRWLGYRVALEVHEILSVGARDIDSADHTPEAQMFALEKKVDPERFAYQKADGRIIISHTLRGILERKWGEIRPTTVIPSGAILFPSRPLPTGKALRSIYYVGNYYPFSGLDYAIQALVHLPQACLTVVGGGGEGDPNYERIRTLVDELGLRERVIFKGFIEPHHLPEIYAGADLLVMPHADFIRAKYFVSPLKLFEYMSARRPIVASDLPTIREVLRHGENALLAQPNDPQSIAAALQLLMDDPDLARRLAEQAYVDAQQYSMEKKCAAIQSFFEGMIG